jgi:probable phosphoglycerate mutase
MTTTFLLICHALSDSTEKCLLGRQPDIHLSPEGKIQARDLSEKIASQPIRAIYSSPLERARETADFLSRKIDLPTYVSQAFNEIDFGDWTGLTFRDLSQIPEWNQFSTFRSGTRIPNGELMMEVQMRAIAELENLYHKHWGQVVAIFTHSDVIKSVVSHALGSPIDYSTRFDINPASVTTLQNSEYGPKVLRMNELLQ